MNILKVKGQGDCLAVTFDNGSQISCPKVDSMLEYELVKEWLKNEKNVIEPEFTMEELEAQAKQLAEISKNEVLATLTVEVDGLVFDANETARSNMMAAILSAELIGKTADEWKVADDSTELITLAQLKIALARAIQRVGEIVKA